jgi:hypothetical protein
MIILEQLQRRLITLLQISNAEYEQAGRMCARARALKKTSMKATKLPLSEKEGVPLRGREPYTEGVLR